MPGIFGNFNQENTILHKLEIQRNTANC